MAPDALRKQGMSATAQDDGSEPLPMTAKVCVALAFAQVVCSVGVLLRFGTGGLVAEADPAEMKWFHSAVVMLLPAMMLEAAHTFSSRSRGLDVELHGRELSAFVVVEYAVKMVCYGCMANFDGGIVHTNMRAVGPQRGCYTVRFIAWSIAVPTLIALNNYPLWSKSGLRSMALRLWPNLLVTWSYVLASWVAQVTPNGFAGWLLVVLSFLSYASAACDQASILSKADSTMLGFRFKVGTVFVKEVLFVAYGAAYLMGAMNWTSPAAEQLFYTSGDVLLKVIQASVLVVVRNWEDLAELRHALERKVETGKEDMCRLFRHASAPILTMTQDGVVVTWNEHLGRLSGTAWSGAIGASIFDLVQDECRASLRSALASCGSGLTSNAVEVTLRCGAEDGRPMRMLLTLIVQLGGDDERRTITAIGQDLTEVAAMRAMQERKSQITAVLGHELRSPLHGIMGLSGSLAEAAASPAQKRQLSMIKGCAARLLDLVTNILEMAKSEKLDSSEAIHKEPVNVMDIVDEVVGMTKAAVDKSGRHLLRDGVEMTNGMCRGELPMVFGDRYKLTQLLYNLVTNAAKFTSAGSIQVFAREVEATGMLEIDITDTGKGIAPEALARIFDPFQQEEDKDSRSFQGIGLGLSVALGIAKLHGGSIRVASRVRRGSTFTVCLPCDFEHRVGLTVSCESDHAEEPVAPAPGVAQPSGDMRKALEDSVGPEFRVERAASSAKALAQLKSSKDRPSMMLLELSKPGLSCVEVAQQLAERSSFLCELPVLTLFATSPQGPQGQRSLGSVLSEIQEKAFGRSSQEASQDVELESLPPMQQQQRQEPAHQPAPQVHQMFGSPGVFRLHPQRVSAGESTTEGRDTPAASMDGAGFDQNTPAFRSDAETDPVDDEVATEFRRRRRSVGAALPATFASRRASIVAKIPPKAEKLPEGLRTGTLSAERDLDVMFYREEIELRDKKLREISEVAHRNRTDAWVAQRRAEALDRELRFVRQLRLPLC